MESERAYPARWRNDSAVGRSILNAAAIARTVSFAGCLSGCEISFEYAERLSSADAADFGRRNSPVVSFSVRAGLHDWKDSRFVDKSWGAQGEMRFAFPETPLDIVLRGHYATVDYEAKRETLIQSL